MITQLNDYIDGALPPDLCAQIEAHLAGCPDCRVVLDTLDWTVRILHNVDIAPPPLPAEVEARLLAHITQ